MQFHHSFFPWRDVHLLTVITHLNNGALTSELWVDGKLQQTFTQQIPLSIEELEALED